MDFIDKYWSKGHILSVSRKLLDWQYYNKRWGHYNFLLAIDNIDDNILGILGYIPTYHFDNNITDADKFIWLSVWKVREDIKKTAIGVQLVSAVFRIEETTNVGTVGNNDTTVPLYKMMKFKNGVLNQYYMISNAINDFKLVGGNLSSNSYPKYNNASFQRLEDESSIVSFIYDIPLQNMPLPKKPTDYYLNRYFYHPFYKYFFIGIKGNITPILLFVCRKVTNEGALAIRITDMYGDMSDIVNLYFPLQNLLFDENAEYIDMYNYGIDEDVIKNSGFQKNNMEESLCIPNYYEPFNANNVVVRFAYHTTDNYAYTIFKGDCDQDRPNQLTWVE